MSLCCLADVLQIAGNGAAVGKAGAILTAHGQSRRVGFVDRLQRLQDFELFIPQGIRFERIRRLHRNKAKELHHVVLDHVANGAGFFVIIAASLNAQGLGNGDLHVIDVRIVPQRLEQDVGEAKRHEVLYRLLAEVVIDAEDISLEENRADHIVDGRGAVAISPDRLLDDDARTRQ